MSIDRYPKAVQYETDESDSSTTASSDVPGEAMPEIINHERRCTVVEDARITLREWGVPHEDNK